MGELHLKPGDIVGGKYRLEKLLGEGAMGAVWAARNERTDRAFAVKFMLPAYAKDATLVQRFLNEARVCGRLEHPSLVEVYDLGIAEELGSSPFLVMELLRGEGLDQLLHRTKRMDPRAICPLLLDVAGALDLAHQAGIVHRDIKPANIFLHRDRTGVVTPKILDFGVSKSVGDDAALHLTRAGTLVGSPLYMSPEQARGQTDIDARADVWSLGVILYQAIAGVVPFDGQNYNAVLSAILTERHKPLSDVVPGVPAVLSETVDLCLVKDRNRRMASAAQLAARLEKVLLHFEANEPPPSSSKATREPPRKEPARAPPSGPPSDATEVMDRDSLPDEVLAEMRRSDERIPIAWPTAAPVDVVVDEDEESPAARSALLRREWLAELAAAVNTVKTDDIVDVAAAIGGEAGRAQRAKRVAAGIEEIEDAAEGNVAETDRAIRLAREELRKSQVRTTAPGTRSRIPLLVVFVVLGAVVGALVIFLMARRA